MSVIWKCSETTYTKTNYKKLIRWFKKMGFASLEVKYFYGF